MAPSNVSYESDLVPRCPRQASLCNNTETQSSQLHGCINMHFVEHFGVLATYGICHDWYSRTHNTNKMHKLIIRMFYKTSKI